MILSFIGNVVGAVALVVALVRGRLARRTINNLRGTVLRQRGELNRLFSPIPAPWWAIPHLDSDCVNARCRVHFPYAQCTALAGPNEWCARARDHKGLHLDSDDLAKLTDARATPGSSS